MRPIIAALLLVTTAFASLPPTQAWRRIFNIGTTDQVAGPPAVDASGYCYFSYFDNSSLAQYNVHLVKIGPAENVAFDKSINIFTGYIPLRTYVSPPISGKQYVYVTGQVDHNGDKWAYIRKYDTAGTDQWGTYVYFASQVGFDDRLVGVFPDANNNVFLVLDQVDAGLHHARFIELDANANTVSDSSNSNIQPERAEFDPVISTTGSWLLSGIYLAGTRPFSGIFGAYNPLTGHYDFGESDDGFYDAGTGLKIQKHFEFTQMHSGNVVTLKTTTTWSNAVAQPSSTYYVEFSNSTFTGGYWHFPTTGPQPPGIGVMAEQFGPNDPIYLVGRPDDPAQMPFLEQYTHTGTRNWRHGGQPADHIFITPEGFFSVFNQASTQTLFLEHFDNGTLTYDWGKSYPGSIAPTNFAGIAFFQNFFYNLVNFPTGGQGYNIFVDRFVSGVCMQSITCVSSVQAGHQLAVTIHLNGNAPAGGLGVGLNSSTNALLMPNGTRAQFLTVPAGSSSLVVNLNAQTVAGNTSATLLAIQNGIRRFAATTVTP